MSARSLPKCRGFIIMSASVILPSVENVSRECRRNAYEFSKIPFSAMVREVEK